MIIKKENFFTRRRGFYLPKYLMKNIKIYGKKTKMSHLIQHPTKRHNLIKYLLILFLFIGYFFFITHKYGVKDGFMVAILTRSFFVFCTPVADAGFLIDFPFRLITNIKMIFSEMMVRTIALGLNLYTFFLHPEIYQKTGLLRLFHQIISHPIPFR
ncbi:MAG: hypothetical protein GXP45_00105 [bacterium]|nr:hypothetical protein [bacterium]